MRRLLEAYPGSIAYAAETGMYRPLPQILIDSNWVQNGWDDGTTGFSYDK